LPLQTLFIFILQHQEAISNKMGH